MKSGHGLTWTERDELLALRRERVVLRRVIAQVQACEDDRCRVCTHCVTALFLDAKPTPNQIPRKYRRLPWSKAPGVTDADRNRLETRRWNGQG